MHMHIAFDIDGTIDRCPEFFAILSKAMSGSGHKVYVISYREDRELAEEDLPKYGIPFDELVLPTEQELRRANPGTWRTEAGRWKADVCRRPAIDVFFEDMPEVVNTLDARTLALIVADPSLGKLRYGADQAHGSAVGPTD
jgi:hypothetical protein